jgi:hypothetical protein
VIGQFGVPTGIAWTFVVFLWHSSNGQISVNKRMLLAVGAAVITLLAGALRAVLKRNARIRELSFQTHTAHGDTAVVGARRNAADEELLTLLWHSSNVHPAFFVHFIKDGDDKMVGYLLEQMGKDDVNLVTWDSEDRWRLTPRGRDYAVKYGLNKSPKPQRVGV